MKVLFIYHNRVESGYMPQSIAVLGGMLRDGGVETKLFDTSFYRDINSPFTQDDRTKRAQQKKGGYLIGQLGPGREIVNLKAKFREEVESYHPDLVAATSTSFEFNSLLDFVTPTTSEMKIPFLVGGVHTTVVPEKAIRKKGLDILCIDEGEKPLLELARRIYKKQSYYDIPNLWFKTPDGKIIKNNIGAFFEKMDELPESDWDLISEYHRIRPFEKEIMKYGWFETSRGCPFNCSYCVNSKLHTIKRQGGIMHPGTYRFFTPEEIVRRMKNKKDKYGYNHIQLIDENMPNMPVSNLEHLAKLFKDQIGVGFFTQARPECFVKTPEKAEIMAEMGCKMVGLGVESGNYELRKNILHRPMKDGIVETAVENLKKTGIMVATYYIIGFPTETEAMIKQTIDLHKRINPDRFSVRFLHPFPGTPIREYCVKNGYIAEDYEDLIQDASFFSNPVLNLPSPPHPTKERLIELRKEFENY